MSVVICLSFSPMTFNTVYIMIFINTVRISRAKVMFITYIYILDCFVAVQCLAPYTASSVKSYSTPAGTCCYASTNLIL